ncbi:MAG: NAD+ synthase [Planctomycetes bacterium]|nr:NAD+ synthase [Planctomycetota bacterium]
MKIALAQINPIIGDISGNSQKIVRMIDSARQAGADLVVFSELSLLGYPPRDLLVRQSFISASVDAVEQLAKQCKGVAALVGYVRPADTTKPGRRLENAAALLVDGAVAAVHVKTLLPTYDVFDETRYFRPGPMPAPIELNGHRIGVTICEDLWDPAALGEMLYESDPVLRLREQGAEVIINMSASPFQIGKSSLREEMIRRQVERTGLPIVYVNQVGGNDELIFDGGSMVILADGTLLGRCKSFQEDFLVVDTDALPVRCENPGEDMEQLAEALKLGLRDYLRKCQFESVVLGLSGGIDSAVVATIAAEAIGPENVLALAMPSRYSSEHSLADARRIAENLKIRLVEVPIEPIHSAYEQSLTPHLPEDYPDTTDQNIQARVRGNIIMAFSNALGYLPLATGNKSELATGYCTLYGDMSGGLCLIGDVPKTMVYRLARYLNDSAGKELIPESVFAKPPSAELKPNQTDQDKLPPYEILDEILQRYIEQGQSIGEIVSAGFDEQIVRHVVKMVVSAEYKRRQAAPTLKVTTRAFGPSRQMPIACRCDWD